jgi:hypothetical protein
MHLHVTRETVYRLPIGDAPKRMALMACWVSLNYGWRVIHADYLIPGASFLRKTKARNTLIKVKNGVAGTGN